jgi:hypothetical protein
VEYYNTTIEYQTQKYNYIIYYSILKYLIN